MPQQTTYPNYPSSAANYPPQPAPSYQPAQPVYPNYPQQQPFPNAPGAPSGYPPANPTPYPSYSPLPTGASYGAPGPTGYNTGYPAQMQHTLNQCKVCGAMIGYGMLACPVCTVPLNMIANPYDPTVTTYLDARALNQPGTSPVYAAPGAYAGRQAHASNEVPEEARQGWNWPAALNSTLWAFTHRAAGWGLLCGTGLFFWVMFILILSAMPASELHGSDSTSNDAGIIFLGGSMLLWLLKTLYLGNKGNAIAWRSGRYTNISQMKNVQQQWKGWSFLVFAIASAVLIAATLISANR